MDKDLEAIVGRLRTDLEAWLDKPSELTKRIADLEAQLRSLKVDLGNVMEWQAAKQMEQARKIAGLQRRKEASEAIAQTCWPLGIRIQVMEPSLRNTPVVRKPGKAKGSKTTPGTTEPHSSEQPKSENH